MPFNNESRSAVYIRASDGHLLVKNPNGAHVTKNRKTGEETRYDAHKNLAPILVTGIDHEPFNDKLKMPAQWKVNLLDQVSRDRYVLAFPTDSYTGQGLLNTLAGIEDYTRPIEISAYETAYKDRLVTRLSVSHCDRSAPEKIKWRYEIEEIPKSVPVVRPDGSPLLDGNGVQVYDTQEKMKFYEAVVARINEKLKSVASFNETANFPSPFPDVKVPETLGAAGALAQSPNFVQDYSQQDIPF